MYQMVVKFAVLTDSSTLEEVNRTIEVGNA